MSMEIMKQAFNALREMHYALGRAHDTMRRPTKYVKAALLQGQSAITALRQVIEQAEDEPRHISYVCPNCHWSLDKQVRTHTPEDIKKIESNWVGLETDHKSAPPRQRSFYDDVGRLIKAGKGFYDDGTPIDYKDIQLKIEGTGEDTFECVEVRIPRPPQRAWVGLTDHELQVLDFNDPERGKLARAVEAKLKERNGG